MTKLLTFGVSLSTAVNAELVANPIILGILFSISVILAFKSVFLARSLELGIYFSASLIFFSKSDFFFNWDSLHTRLNSHYEAWGYKIKKDKKVKPYRKSI